MNKLQALNFIHFFPPQLVEGNHLSLLLINCFVVGFFSPTRDII